MRAAVSTVRFPSGCVRRVPRRSAVRTKSSPWVHRPATGPGKSSHIRRGAKKPRQREKDPAHAGCARRRSI